ncbi:prepilin-type N-terminal cleavage/methylation domain-containing protein, partial [Candidatus Omnitrophota bacterium]
MRHKAKGFTLIEIMIVVAIIAVLAAIAVPNMLRARKRGNEVCAQTILKMVASAMEMYLDRFDVYPKNTIWLSQLNPPLTNQEYICRGGCCYLYCGGYEFDRSPPDDPGAYRLI